MNWTSTINDIINKKTLFFNRFANTLILVVLTLNELNKHVNISLVDEATIKFNKNLVLIPAYISKGLEFDAVIVYNNRLNSYGKNERNLLYVAATRAQHELYIYN